ncbi:hypothetical protein CPB86DRAFT_365865 [Serendipita vermifera]|nr:hypothetical protein CPB86DRAFT_365865 [Serendipita vermifera]
MPTFNVTLPDQPDPLLLPSSSFPSDFSVPSISKNVLTTYDSSFSSVYPFATSFASPNINDSMNFFDPRYGSEPFRYVQQPGCFPAAPPNFSPDAYFSCQYNRHRPVPSPRGLGDASYNPSTYTKIQPQFRFERSPCRFDMNSQISYSAPGTFLSEFQPRNSTHIPYMSTHPPSFGHDVIENAECSAPISVNQSSLYLTKPPETRRVFHNYHQVGEIIEASPNQSFALSLG